jgi:hypothetical protein
MNNMDTNMEDVVKIPETHQMPQVPLDPPTVPILDSWITSLMECKQLSETEVQRLCEKVLSDLESDRRMWLVDSKLIVYPRLEKYCKKSPMYSQW